MLIYIIQLCIVHAIQDCSRKVQDEIRIIAKVQEVQKYPLEEIFYLEDYHGITISQPSNSFSILLPIYQQSHIQAFTQSKYHRYSIAQPVKFLSVKLARDKQSHASINKYVILDQRNEGFLLHLTKANQGSQGRSQQFDQLLAQRDEDSDLTCFDLDFFNGDSLYLDCSHKSLAPDPLENFILYYNLKVGQITVSRQNSVNSAQYKICTKRIFLNAGRLYYRVYPSSGLEQGESSTIESLVVEGENMQFKSSLTQEMIRNILKDQTFSFNIIDVNVSTEGEIALLNSNGQILVLRYLESKDEWEILFNQKHQGPILDFEFDFSSFTYIVVDSSTLTYKDFEYLFSKELANPKITITKSFLLVLTEDEIYQFSKSLDKIFDKEHLGFQYITQDKDEDEVILYDYQGYSRYIAQSRGFLSFSGDVQTSPLQARLQYKKNQVTCTVSIIHEVVAQESTKLFATMDDQYFFPYPIEYGKGELQHNRIYEGPMIIYDGTDDKQVQLDITSHSLFQLSGLIQKGEIVIFNHVKKVKDTLKYITQTGDQTLSLYECTFEYQCKLIFAQIIDVLLNNKNFIVNYQDDNYHLYILQGSQTIRLITPELNKLYNVNGPYDQISQDAFGILARNKEVKRIDLLNFSQLELIWTIQEQDLVQLGLMGWNPKILIASFDSDKFLTISSNQIILFQNSKQRQYQILYTDKIENECVEIDGAMFADRFAIACRTNSGLLVINSYRIDTRTNIMLEKTVKYTGFIYDVEMKFQYSFQSQLIFIVARTSKQEPIIAIFDISKIGISVPFTFRKFDLINWNAADDIYSVSVDLQGKSQVLQIHQNLQARYTNYISSYNYSVVHSYSVTVKDYLQTQMILQKQDLYIINRYSLIYMNQQDVSNEFLKLNANNQNKCFDQKWIVGQITDLTIDCLQCNIKDPAGSIRIRQPFHHVKDIPFEQGTLIKELRFGQTVILYSQRAVLLTKRYFQPTIIDFKESESCVYFVPTVDGMLVSCQLNGLSYIVKFICDSNSCVRQENQLQTPILVDYFIDLINGFLFLGSHEKILIYYLPDGILSAGQLIGSTQHKLRSYEIIQTTEKIYHIYGVTFENKFALYYFVIRDNQALPPTIQEFSLYEMIKLMGYFVQSDTNFTSIKKLPIKKTNEFLLTTKDLAHFILTISVGCQGDNCQLESYTADYALAPYGNWVIDDYPLVEIFDDIAVFQYSSKDEKSNLLAMYKLAEPEDKSVPITFFGAISSTSQANKNQFLLYDEEGINYLLAPKGEKKEYSQYSIDGDYAICFSGDVKEQGLVVTAKNDFNLNWRHLNLEKVLDSKPSRWWIWLLLAITLIVVAAGGAYFCYKKKKNAKTSEEALL